MATAIHESRTAGRLPRCAREVLIPESMEFLIFEDNAGDHHWTIVAGDGVTVARSGNFTSYQDAERAAQHVRDGAASARFEPRAVAKLPDDLSAPRSSTSDASDAERWLAEDGSFSSEAVAKWQTSR
jgi:uncharacterized protein YegP (UPF0339 family)